MISFAQQPTYIVGSDFINGGPEIPMNSKVGTVIVRSKVVLCDYEVNW
jgi:hypothetical protein